MKVVAINGVAPDNWKNVINYYKNGDYLILSLKTP
jgi:hypothetical protein